MPDRQIFLAQVATVHVAQDALTVMISAASVTHALLFMTPNEASTWCSWIQHGATQRRNSAAAAHVQATSAGAALTGISRTPAQPANVEEQAFYAGVIERPVRTGYCSPWTRLSMPNTTVIVFVARSTSLPCFHWRFTSPSFHQAAEQLLRDNAPPNAPGAWLIRKSQRDGQLVLSWLRKDGRKGHVKVR